VREVVNDEEAMAKKRTDEVVIEMGRTRDTRWRGRTLW
jgi:hypothetical protein